MRSSTVLFDEGMAVMAHRLTADQLDFIVTHELGHVVLDHPRRLRAESRPGCDVTTVRHEFEFAADAFALGLMRSKLVKEVLNKSTMPKAAEAGNNPLEEVTASLHEYQQGLGAAFCCSSIWISFSAPGNYCATSWAGTSTSDRRWTLIHSSGTQGISSRLCWIMWLPWTTGGCWRA